MPNRRPLVSIVTPSYNQGEFIEETILSVLTQDYPRIEYIVIDGGSTDETLEILRKYEDRLTWVSEPDEGQSDAINRGFRRSKGEILAWLNSDDTYLPGAISTAVDFLLRWQDVSLLYGGAYYIDRVGEQVEVVPAEDFDLEKMICRCLNPISQAAAFFRREVLETVRMLDTDLHYMMDFDLWLRIGKVCKVQAIPNILANARIYPGTKQVSYSHELAPEIIALYDKFFSSPGLDPALQARRAEAYSSAYISVAMAYYRACLMRETRAWLLKALRLYPRNLSTTVLNVWFRTFLGPKLVTYLRAARARRAGGMQRARLGL